MARTVVEGIGGVREPQHDELVMSLAMDITVEMKRYDPPRRDDGQGKS